jgi:ankyrin repeat domain-containing protein 50
MSTTVANAAERSLETRLAQALSDFEAGLSDEQRKLLQSYRSQWQQPAPTHEDVMRLIAEIDRQSLKRGCRRCFGPHMASFLLAIQEMVALEEVIIGERHKSAVRSIWPMVQFSMLVSSIDSTSSRLIVS